MKRLTGILVSLLLVFLVLPAQAGGGDNRLSFNSVGEQSVPVYGSVIETAQEGMAVYSVDISWGGMDFDYQRTTTRTWDPLDMEYDSSSSGGWVTPTAVDSVTGLRGNQIRISNRSNSQIAYTLSFEPKSETYSSVKGTFSCTRDNGTVLNFQERIPLNNAEGDDAMYTEDVVDLTLSGELPASISGEGFQVGSITVKVYPYQG